LGTSDGVSCATYARHFASSRQQHTHPPGFRARRVSFAFYHRHTTTRRVCEVSKSTSFVVFFFAKKSEVTFSLFCLDGRQALHLVSTAAVTGFHPSRHVRVEATSSPHTRKLPKSCARWEQRRDVLSTLHDLGCTVQYKKRSPKELTLALPFILIVIVPTFPPSPFPPQQHNLGALLDRR
jgi:hypothetical protein